MWNNTDAKIYSKVHVPDDQEKVDLIEPTTGKLFFEHKDALIFCKPRLMPLKSQALERLEEMQRETAEQLLKKRLNASFKNNTEPTNKIN